MKKSISLIVIIVLLFISCSPQKRLNRIIHNHPELITAVDTFKDTITIPGFVYDTIVSFEKSDTVFITKDSTTVRIIKINNDSLDVSIINDTIYLPIKVPVPVVKVEEKIIIPGYLKLILYLFIVYFICVLIKWFIRRKEKGK